MTTKGPPPTYTETCTNCGAVTVSATFVNIDAKNNRCPKCGEAYNVSGSEKWQLGN
jgi:rRNA maturation protein Nop10